MQLRSVQMSETKLYELIFKSNAEIDLLVAVAATYKINVQSPD